MSELRNRDEIEADVAARQRIFPDWTLFVERRLAADVGPLLERLDQQTAEIERLHAAHDLQREYGDLQMQRGNRLLRERNDARAGLAAAQARADQLEDVLGNVWLYIDWRYVTKQLTTEQKEMFAAAVEAWSTRLNDGEAPTALAERWWLSARPLPEPEQPTPFADSLDREAEASAAVARALTEEHHQPASSFGYAYCAVCKADWPCHAAKERADV